MKSKHLFPNHLSDEAAADLVELLHTLAAACEYRYFSQIRRHHANQRNLYDPEQPWLSPPSKP
jgi:hypothetical protein